MHADARECTWHAREKRISSSESRDMRGRQSPGGRSHIDPILNAQSNFMSDFMSIVMSAIAYGCLKKMYHIAPLNTCGCHHQSLTSLPAGNQGNCRVLQIQQNRYSFLQNRLRNRILHKILTYLKKKINQKGAFLTILASKVEDIKNQIWRVGGDCKALFTEFRDPQIPSNPLYQTLKDFSLTFK